MYTYIHTTVICHKLLIKYWCHKTFRSVIYNGIFNISLTRFKSWGWTLWPFKQWCRTFFCCCIFPSEITSDVTSDFLSSFLWHVGRFFLHVRRICLSDVFLLISSDICRTFMAHFVRQCPTRPTKAWSVHPPSKQKNSLAVRHSDVLLNSRSKYTFFLFIR